MTSDRLTYLVGLSQVNRDTLPAVFHEAVAELARLHKLDPGPVVEFTKQDLLGMTVWVSGEGLDYDDTAERISAWIRRNTAAPVHVPQISDNSVVLGIAVDAAGDLDVARIQINNWIKENWPKATTTIPDLSSEDIVNIDIAADQEGCGGDDRLILAYNLAVSRIPGASTPSMLEFDELTKENTSDHRD